MSVFLLESTPLAPMQFTPCVERVVACAQADKAGTSYKHPYDLGLCGNLHAICGDSLPAWFLPTRAAADGDGLSYASGWHSAAGDMRVGL